MQRTWGSRTLSIQELEILEWLELRVKEKVKQDEADERGEQKSLRGLVAHIEGFGFSKTSEETLKGFKWERGMILCQQDAFWFSCSE